MSRPQRPLNGFVSAISINFYRTKPNDDLRNGTGSDRYYPIG